MAPPSQLLDYSIARDVTACMKTSREHGITLRDDRVAHDCTLHTVSGTTQSLLILDKIKPHQDPAGC